MWLARGMAAASVIMWASSYQWMKTLLSWLHPVSAAEARFVIASLVLFGLALPTGTLLPALRGHWRSYMALGVIGIAIFQLLVFFALEYTSPVNAAVIMALTPVLIMAGGAMFAGEPFGWRAGIGMAVSVLGAVLAVLGDTAKGFSGFHLDAGEPLAFLAACCMAFYTVASRRLLPSGVPAITSTALAIGFGTLFLLPLSFFGEAPRGEPSLKILACLFGVSVGATVFAYMAWTRAVQRLGVTEPSILYNFVPVITMLIAAALGQPPHLEQVIGGVLVVLGVTICVVPVGGARPASKPG